MPVACLGSYPFEIGRKAALDWDRDDLGKFVGMAGVDCRFELGVAFGRGLDQHGMLFIVLYVVFPAKN
jgi:hypothetical protein